MLMCSGDYHHRRSRSFTGTNTRGRIFEHHTVVRSPSELARGELITRRIGLAHGNIFGGDEDGRCRQSRSCERAGPRVLAALM